MNVSRTLCVGLAALAVAVGGSTAMGAFITFQMQGIITSVEDPRYLTGVEVNDIWTLEYTFDSLQSDMNPDDPTSGLYDELIVFLNIGGASFDPVILPSLEVRDATTDTYTVSGFPWFPGASVPMFSAGLIDNDGTVFSDDSLPLAPPYLTEFESTIFRLIDRDVDVELFGAVYSFTPEPATLSLLALGALLVTRRRRYQSQQPKPPTGRSAAAGRIRGRESLVGSRVPGPVRDKRVVSGVR